VRETVSTRNWLRPVSRRRLAKVFAALSDPYLEIHEVVGDGPKVGRIRSVFPAASEKTQGPLCCRPSRRSLEDEAGRPVVGSIQPETLSCQRPESRGRTRVVPVRLTFRVPAALISRTGTENEVTGLGNTKVQLEECESGRIGRSRKPLWSQGHRGFESHLLRSWS
jgi:hypothetical protein